MTKRSIIIYGILMLAFFGILARLYALTGDGLAQAAQDQATVTVRAANVRGTIYDCKLKPLVNTVTEHRACIAVYPATLSMLSDQLTPEMFEQIAGRLMSGRPITASFSGALVPTPGVIQFTVPVRTGGQQPGNNRLLAPH
ncbi:MAG: hypothetical protein FWE80_08880, partial [Oscillospiraceae bacterium]|nr:hypothetical protein [Oscillospiraceae bacterium]